MENENRTQIIVDNLGPVKKCKVQLKPLTVFIGANNSGKTYIAQLIYALTRGLNGMIPESIPKVDVGTKKEAERNKAELLGKLRKAKKEGKTIHFRDLPESFKELCNEWIKEMMNKMPDTLEEAMRDYFGCDDARELVRQDKHSRTLRVRVKNDREDTPFLDFKMRQSSRRSRLEWRLPDFNVYKIDNRILRMSLSQSEYYDLDDLVLMFMMTWWRSVLREKGIVDRSAYYLPGARSGILQGQQLFASMFAEYSRRSIGLRRLDIPPFSGVAGDFLQVLWERLFSRPYRIRRDRKFKSESILKVLEDDIFKGKVTIERGGKGAPLLLYEYNGMKIPLHRASSMIAEVAPLALWIKGILDSGDLLIFDEPEAHLHPSNQRAIARVITRLVEAGVKVLITTHSPLILQQLSNYILASSLDKESQRKYSTEEDIIEKSKVGVYLFKLTNTGTEIEEVEIEEGFGISEEDFVRVYDEIGEETYLISREHPRNREDVHAEET